MKKIFLSLTFLLLIILFAPKVNAECDPGSVACEKWADAYEVGVDSLTSYLPFSVSEVDTNNKDVFLMFYPVKSWEVKACMYGLSTDSQRKDINSQAYAGINNPETVYDLTITMNAEYYNYSRNIILYNVAWYVQPKQGTLNYSIYLYDSKNNNKEYFSDTIGIVSDYISGSSGYASEYHNITFDKVVMEDSSKNKLYEANIYATQARYS